MFICSFCIVAVYHIHTLCREKDLTKHLISLLRSCAYQKIKVYFTLSAEQCLIMVNKIDKGSEREREKTKNHTKKIDSDWVTKRKKKFVKFIVECMQSWLNCMDVCMECAKRKMKNKRKPNLNNIISKNFRWWFYLFRYMFGFLFFFCVCLLFWAAYIFIVLLCCVCTSAFLFLFDDFAAVAFSCVLNDDTLIESSLKLSFLGCQSNICGYHILA